MAYYQRVWAQIDDKGIVQNTIVCDDYETANFLSRCSYGEQAIAVQINNWSVGIGNRYIDGVFYRVNPDTGELTKVAYVPDVEDEVKVNTSDITSAQEAIVEIYEMSLTGAVGISTMAMTREITISPIARVYASLIQKGRKTIEDVPESLRAEVEAALSGDIETA